MERMRTKMRRMGQLRKYPRTNVGPLGLQTRAEAGVTPECPLKWTWGQGSGRTAVGVGRGHCRTVKAYNGA